MRSEGSTRLAGKHPCQGSTLRYFRPVVLYRFSSAFALFQALNFYFGNEMKRNEIK
jgi:hypothetical protein